MRTYLFKSIITVKPIDRGKWWIDRKISNIYINANNIREALKDYKNKIEEYDITISDSALKNKSKLYIDKANKSIQIGYVITGKILFENDNRKWVERYIDLWVEIQEVKNPFIEKLIA